MNTRELDKRMQTASAALVDAFRIYTNEITKLAQEAAEAEISEADVSRICNGRQAVMQAEMDAIARKALRRM